MVEAIDPQRKLFRLQVFFFSVDLGVLTNFLLEASNANYNA
jgi:hypothetical protein